MKVKCPKCRGVLISEAHEHKEFMVVKVRLFKYPVSGGPVKGKCRHCGYFATIPNLKAVHK